MISELVPEIILNSEDGALEKSGGLRKQEDRTSEQKVCSSQRKFCAGIRIQNSETKDVSNEKDHVGSGLGELSEKKN